MRLLVELAHEHGTPALVNIHDVGLAQSFADRIIGLSAGQIVFDGTSQQVTAEVLTEIYGEEDWSTTIRKIEDDDQDTEKGLYKHKDRITRETAAG
jgi:phosphonate transport system ATP-binding protein